MEASANSRLSPNLILWVYSDFICLDRALSEWTFSCMPISYKDKHDASSYKRSTFTEGSCNWRGNGFIHHYLVNTTQLELIQYWQIRYWFYSFGMQCLSRPKKMDWWLITLNQSAVVQQVKPSVQPVLFPRSHNTEAFSNLQASK